MNLKYILLIVGVLIITLGIIGYLYIQENGQGIKTTPSETQVTDTNQYLAKQHPFNFDEFFKGETKTLSSLNTSYGTLSFSLLADEEHANSRNSTYGVFLNNELVGEVGGQGFAMDTLSPNGRYFAVRSRSTMGCAGMCQSFSIYIVDLKEKEVSFVQYPKDAPQYAGSIAADSNFIESYSWQESDTLVFKTFLVLSGEEGVYRATPKQLWNYDISTKEYTLVSTYDE